MIQQLAQENVNLTGGRLKEGQTEYLVRTVNEILRPEQLEDLVVSAEGRGPPAPAGRGQGPPGLPRNGRSSAAWTAEESVEVGIFKAGGTNTVTVSDRGAGSPSRKICGSELEEDRSTAPS